MNPTNPADQVTETAAQLRRVIDEVAKTIVGQQQLTEKILIALLADGHVLIEGVPGLAKTRTVRAFSEALGGSWQRVQFTPDLVPSDLIGTRVWRPDRGEFTREIGPVATNFLLADEINRAPAKVQSALLEAMEERQVTIGRETVALPRPFLVLATQNPVENEGTYPLPEAQTDRFVMRIDVTYPSERDELEIVRRTLTGTETIDPVLTPQGILDAQALRAKVYVPENVAAAAVRLVGLTRDAAKISATFDGMVALGAGVRASLALVACAQARALLHNRKEVTLGDLAELAGSVLAHRLVLTYRATVAGITQQDIVAEAVNRTASWQ